MIEKPHPLPCAEDAVFVKAYRKRNSQVNFLGEILCIFPILSEKSGCGILLQEPVEDTELGEREEYSMIGTGLRKLAAENGMKVAKGVAYGSLRGYAATMSEGSGYKQIVFATRILEPANEDALRSQINQRNVASEFRVQNVAFAPNGINIVFNDVPGTLKKMTAFLDWFLPLLEQYGATKADICNECGLPLGPDATWLLQDNVAAFHLHSACAQKLQRTSQAEYAQRRQEDTGSYLKGTLGALAGAGLGAVLWAVVMLLGYIAGVVGFAIGWLAEKGYTLLHGKNGKGKIAILIVAVIFGVLLGTVLADVFTLVNMINTGELDIAFTEIPTYILLMLQMVPEYQQATLSNIGMGLLFAALGVYTVIRQVKKDVSEDAFVTLE